ncbi:hypothetical protein D1AOALGA4SA_11554 [Olavius algarvensis Delta 1 endosymbiont]|nr:hypothetical protein D1AOALGA4SA_11554 [Olavius algarvensis Delta 1 endosymbiont]
MFVVQKFRYLIFFDSKPLYISCWRTEPLKPTIVLCLWLLTIAVTSCYRYLHLGKAFS